MTDKLRAAAEQALEALDSMYADELHINRKFKKVEAARVVLRTALAEQPAEQEPVAWVVDINGTENLEWHSDVLDDLVFGTAVQPLYTEPKPAKRKPLTDDEIERCMKQAYSTAKGRLLEHAFARAIEAAHGIGETK